MNEWVIHGVQTGGLFVVGWVVVSKINRILSLMTDYPPHRHVNGTKILYPPDYAPGEIQRSGD